MCRINFTAEQLLAIDAVDNNKDDIVLIEASAGTGKTKVVTTAFNRNNANRRFGISLAFNSKIAKENKNVFPNWFEVRTLHSFGYKYIVSPRRLTVKPNMTVDDFNGVSGKEASIYLSYLNKFCSSDIVSINEFLTKEKCPARYRKKAGESIKNLFMLCENGDIPISHAMYLKLFQVLLVHGDIEIETDVLFMDEFADINACYYSVFKHIKAKKKVVVYDQSQAIYRFNNSINGGEKLQKDFQSLCKVFSLTQTFRCSKEISNAVNKFGTSHIKTPFNGIVGSDVDIDSPKRFMLLTRTNMYLLNHALEFIENKIKFVFARSYKSIIDPVLYLKIGVVEDSKKNIDDVSDENRYIVKEYNAYIDETKYDTNAGSFSSWIKNNNTEDPLYLPDLARVASISLQFSADELIAIKKYVSNKNNNDDNVILGTGFSTKGDEADMVYIADDLNKAAKKTISNMKKDEDNTDDDELLTYYVACTRAKKWLINATILEGYGYKTHLDINNFIAEIKAFQIKTDNKLNNL